MTTENNDTRQSGTATRRELFAAAGSAAVGAAAGVAALTPNLAAAQGTVGQECMTITYRWAGDVRFDFGSDSVKLLQIVAEDPPQLVAAACAQIPEQAKANGDQYRQYQQNVPMLIPYKKPAGIEPAGEPLKAS